MPGERASTHDPMESPNIPEHKLAKNQIATEENLELFKAAKRGELKRVQSLLSVGANANFYFHPEEGASAMHVAAEGGHTAVLRELIRAGGQLNDQVLTNQNTSLHMACQAGKLEAAELLLDEGARVNIANCFGNSPLQSALMGGAPDVVRMLVKRGAEGGWQNHKRSTPLHFACYAPVTDRIKVAMVDELLTHGRADVKAEDEDGMTALHIAARDGPVTLVEYLLEHGADVEAMNSKGHTAAFYANMSNNQAAADLLSGSVRSGK